MPVEPSGLHNPFLVRVSADYDRTYYDALQRAERSIGEAILTARGANDRLRVLLCAV